MLSSKLFTNSFFSFLSMLHVSVHFVQIRATNKNHSVGNHATADFKQIPWQLPGDSLL